MCGLVGFSGKNNYNLDKIKLLLVHNSLERGDDSLGIYSPLNGVNKKAGKPVELIPQFTFTEDNYFIGHVRAGTSGSKTEDKNAHPFVHGDLIGVMNGTLSNIWTLCSKNGFNSHDFNVDSDVLFAILSKDKKPSVLSEIEGGCAILMADKSKPEILYVYRNSNRELYRGNLDGSMYISSIKESLEIIGCEDVKIFKEDYMYTIKNGKITNSKYIKKYTPPVANHRTLSQGNTNNYSLNYSSTTLVDNKKLKGQWIKFDTVDNGYSYYDVAYNENLLNFTFNKWYYVDSYNINSVSEIFVIDDNGNSVCMSLYSFDYRNPMKLVDGDWAKATEDLDWFNKAIIAYKNNIVFVYKVSANKALVRRHYDDKNSYMIDLRYLKPIDQDELQSLLNGIPLADGTVLKMACDDGRKIDKETLAKELEEERKTKESLTNGDEYAVSTETVDENLTPIIFADNKSLVEIVPNDEFLNENETNIEDEEDGEEPNDFEDSGITDLVISKDNYEIWINQIDDSLQRMKDYINKDIWNRRDGEVLMQLLLDIESLIDRQAEEVAQDA